MLLRDLENTIPIVSVSVLQTFFLELFWFLPNLDFKAKDDIHIIEHQKKTTLSRQPHFFALTAKIFRRVNYSNTHMTATVPISSVASKREIFPTV